MDIDLIMRQIRSVVAFIQKWEPMLEQMKPVFEQMMNEKRAAEARPVSSGSEEPVEHQGLMVEEHQVPGDHSEPKTADLEGSADESATPVATAEQDRAESKPAGSNGVVGTI